jgi:hypothetical protein
MVVTRAASAFIDKRIDHFIHVVDSAMLMLIPLCGLYAYAPP